MRTGGRELEIADEGVPARWVAERKLRLAGTGSLRKEK
jgi:hypothetical protein